MANRINCVPYAFQANFASLAATTTFSFASITISLPETTTRTFKSVFLEVDCQDNIAAASSSVTAPVIGIQLGAAGVQNYSPTVDPNQDQYHSLWNHRYVVDCTSYFTTNFGAGSTQTAVASVKLPIVSSNHSARLIITYQFSDVDDTRVKVVKIPVEGMAGAAATALTELGTNDIPNLSTYCPEGSVTFTNVHFEITYSERRASASTFQPAYALDAEAEQAELAHQVGSAGNGDTSSCRMVWLRNDMTTNATHAFKARSTVASTVYNMTVVLVAVYTYSESGTSTVLNSVRIPFEDANYGVGINATGSRETWQASIYVEEPVTITLKQSAVRFSTVQSNVDVAQDPVNVRVGGQAYRSYTHPGITAATMVSWGQESFQLRCDGSAANGTGMTLARGLNTVTFDAYSNGTNSDTMHTTQAYLLLNYTSSKATSGTATHNKTIESCPYSSTWAGDGEAFTDLGNLASVTPPETAWWLNGISTTMWLTRYQNSIQAMRVLSGEGKGSGSLSGPAYFHNNSGVGLDCVAHATSRPKYWDRYAEDPDAARCAPFATRDWQQSGFCTIGNSVGVSFLYTYHSIKTFTVAGIISGYTGDGSGVTVNVHRDDTKELVISGTSTAGGNFSIAWYDSTINVFTEAWQDDTHVGRSKPALAT